MSGSGRAEGTGGDTGLLEPQQQARTDVDDEHHVASPEVGVAQVEKVMELPHVPAVALHGDGQGRARAEEFALRDALLDLCAEPAAERVARLVVGLGKQRDLARREQPVLHEVGQLLLAQAPVEPRVAEEVADSQVAVDAVEQPQGLGVVGVEDGAAHVDGDVMGAALDEGPLLDEAAPEGDGVAEVAEELLHEEEKDEDEEEEEEEEEEVCREG